MTIVGALVEFARAVSGLRHELARSNRIVIAIARKYGVYLPADVLTEELSAATVVAAGAVAGSVLSDEELAERSIRREDLAKAGVDTNGGQ